MRPFPPGGPTVGFLTFLIPALFLVVAGPAAAATMTGIVQGHVADMDGEPAGDVQVILVPAKAGLQVPPQITGEDGSFKIPHLPLGIYTLSIYKPGYTAIEIPDVEVTPGCLLAYSVELKPEEKHQEEVEVIANRGSLPIEETNLNQEIDGRTLRKLPLLNQSIQDILMLFEGVTRTGGSESTEISVMGGTSGQIQFNVDGHDLTNVLSGGPAIDISTVSMEHFELIRGGYQAEYGKASTGIVNIITRSGSDETEGEYALLWRDASITGATQEALSPVQVLWDGLLNLDLFPQTQPVYARGLTNWSSFGGLPSTLEDDNNPSPRRRIQHQVGVGGPVVPGRVYFFTSLDVLQNDTGSPFGEASFQSDVGTYLGKISVDRGRQNRTRFEIHLQHSDSGGYANPQWAPEVATENTRGVWTLSASDLNIFSRHGWLQGAALDTSVAWTHQYLTSRPSVPDATHQNNVWLPPGGVIQLRMDGPVSDRDYTTNDLRLNASLTKSFVNHNIKFGGEYGYQTIHGFEERFPVFNDFRLAFSGSFNPVGDVLGSLGQMVDPGDPQKVDDSAQLASVYFQDLWRVNDRLTIEPGLRLDWQDFVGRILISPRIGISWDPVGNRKTQIQFNYGHFYQNLFLEALLWDLRPDQTVSEVLAGREATAGTVGFDVTSLPELVRASIEAGDNAESLARVVPRATQIYDIDDRLTSPLNEQWNIQLRRMLPGNIVAGLSYSEAKRKNAVTVTRDVLDDGSGVRGVPHSVERALFSTTGSEEYKGWSLSLTKPFRNRWTLQASYSQQQIKGPIIRAGDPLDPLSIETDIGVLDRDRTEVVSLSASVMLPWRMNMSLSYRYQTGLPRTPRALSFGLENISNDPGNPVLSTRVNVARPLGSNSVRMPPDRSLDISVWRRFLFGRDNTIDARFTIFNLTNEFNVTDGIVTFGDLRDPNPLQHPPLAPKILPTAVDIPRTVQLEFRIRF